jgi:hypothetical protein
VLVPETLPANVLVVAVLVVVVPPDGLVVGLGEGVGVPLGEGDAVGDGDAVGGGEAVAEAEGEAAVPAPVVPATTAAIAAAASMRPNWTVPVVRASVVDSMAVTMSEAGRPGAADRSSAARPATTGVADDVPPNRETLPLGQVE